MKKKNRFSLKNYETLSVVEPTHIAEQLVDIAHYQAKQSTGKRASERLEWNIFCILFHRSTYRSRQTNGAKCEIYKPAVNCTHSLLVRRRRRQTQNENLILTCVWPQKYTILLLLLELEQSKHNKIVEHQACFGCCCCKQAWESENKIACNKKSLPIT